MKIKQRVLFIITISLLLLVIVGCDALNNSAKDSTNNEITNIVTNEITQTIVDYNGEFSVEDLETAVEVAVKKVEHAVLGVTLKKVTTSKINGVNYEFEDTESIGSGVVYKQITNYNGNGSISSYTYYMYTNAHVILSDYEGEHVVYAYLGDYDIEIEAEILGYDEKIDLACLKFDSYYYIEPVELANTDSLEKGNFVIAVGNPDGYDYYGSVTFGVISNLGCHISFDTDGDGTQDYVGEYIQTDAAINPGNSGGGLFTLDGKLIGINSIKLASSEIDNMGFAIPINIAKIAMEEYLELGKEIIRPRLGIVCIAVRDMSSSYMIENGITGFPNIYGDEKPYGIYIESFGKNGTLVNIGLSKGDILLTFDGHKLYNNTDISGYLNSLDDYRIGTKVTITYYSNSSKTVETIQLTLKTGD